MAKALAGHYWLRVLFRTYYGRNLRSVKLLINKMDLVREAVRRGYISSVSADGVEQFVRKQFSGIEQRIEEACKANDLAFRVHFISARRDLGVREMFAPLLKGCGVKGKVR